MIPTILASGMILYGIIQFGVALSAVLLALKWNRHDLLPGLFFLFLYALLEVFDIFFFAIVGGILLDVAQFGFILLALLSFILAMHPSWARKFESSRMGKGGEQDPVKHESAMAILKRM